MSFLSRVTPLATPRRAAGSAFLALTISLVPTALQASADPAKGPALSAPTVPPRATIAKPTAKSTSRSVTKSASAKSTASKSAAKGSVASASKGFGSGSRGDAVVALQTRLQELKYDITDVEGKYGAQTYHAVMAFQKVNGLSRTGRADPKTLAALETATDPAPMLPDGGPDRVEISLKGQYLAMYKGGELFKLLSVSTGTGKPFCALDPDTGKDSCDVANTPAGSYRVYNRIFGYRESRLGLLYNPLYFNGGIAIHGAASVPATPASHGCVRIPMVSAEWVPNEIGDGTPVYVIGDKLPTPLKSKTTGSTTTTAVANPLGATTVPGATTIPGATTVPPTTVTTLPPTTTTPGSARLLTSSTTTPGSNVVAVTSSTAPPATTTTVVQATSTTKFQTP